MKRVLLVALAALGAVLAAPLTTQQYEFLFTRFVDQYQKNYEVSTFFSKYNTFKANLDYVLAENSKGKSYTLAINEFGDLTAAEFKARMGFRGEEAAAFRSLTTTGETADGSVVDTPTNDDSFDWNNQGAVTPVKNQGQCGSCWAFSATGSMEATWKIKSGSLVSMSEQQLVDCSGSTGNQGCNGGLMDKAFQWVIKNGGICGETTYPYTARGGSCKTTCTKVAKFTSFKDVPQGNESALMSALQTTAISVAVQADKSAWQFYSSGVLDDASCGTSLNHGVLLVGYGTQGKQYWRVKNSWGTSWGESGYIRLVRGKNQCGIASMNSYILA